jgi:hypothetical protein
MSSDGKPLKGTDGKVLPPAEGPCWTGWTLPQRFWTASSKKSRTATCIWVDAKKFNKKRNLKRSDRIADTSVSGQLATCRRCYDIIEEELKVRQARHAKKSTDGIAKESGDVEFDDDVPAAMDIATSSASPQAEEILFQCEVCDDEEPATKQCEVCDDDEPAIKYCASCTKHSYFCEECYAFTHRKAKYASHTSVPLKAHVESSNVTSSATTIGHSPIGAMSDNSAACQPPSQLRSSERISRAVAGGKEPKSPPVYEMKAAASPKQAGSNGFSAVSLAETDSQKGKGLYHEDEMCGAGPQEASGIITWDKVTCFE